MPFGIGVGPQQPIELSTETPKKGLLFALKTTFLTPKRGS
ncbi:MAG: hypothetical protein QG577_697 [Thermodesulfobacteriota bacterium]|nr:hypothetical protein [Thermodesulfobacteriota bacterium]